MSLARVSPNCGPRRDGLRPHLIVLHYTAMASCAAAVERLCDPDAQVSAHYVVTRTGEVLQLVDEADRAWHAGAGSWGGRGDVNSRSIGIELDNDGASPFAEPLMAALERLLPGIMGRWRIPPEGVIGHSDMAPGRKSDPGRLFDWRRLARAGLSVWPSPEAEVPEVDDAAFVRLAAQFGYDPRYGTDLVLEAFRQRFRPQAEEPLGPADMAAIADLSARYPVDRVAGNA